MATATTLLNTLVRTAGGDVAQITNEQQIYYVLSLIKRLLPYLPLWEDAQKQTIPEHAGGFGASGVINLRKFASLAVDTTPLSEGVPPDGLSLTTSTVTLQLAQYGDWIKISDLAATVAIDDVVMQAMEVLGENAGRKLHQVIMNSLTGGDVTQIVYGGSATAANQLLDTDVMTSTTIKKAVRTLEANNVPRYPDGYYRGFFHTFQQYDIMNDSLWLDVSRYNGGVAGSNAGLNLMKGEVGAMHGVRFRQSTETLSDTAGSGSAHTYSAFIYGPDAFGVFDLKSQAVSNIDNETGRGMQIKTIPVNTPTKDDPLGQFGLVGWKAAFASKVIDPLRIVRVRTGASQ